MHELVAMPGCVGDDKAVAGVRRLAQRLGWCVHVCVQRTPTPGAAYSARTPMPRAVAWQCVMADACRRKRRAAPAPQAAGVHVDGAMHVMHTARRVGEGGDSRRGLAHVQLPAAWEMGRGAGGEGGLRSR